MENLLKFEGLSPFDFFMVYNENGTGEKNINEQHAHGECEIYINVTGDVSFMVEENIYKISPGDIIITRPGERHHCIYHSNKVHKHYWMLFRTDNNEKLFDLFFKRKQGEGNLIALTEDKTKELFSVCNRLLKYGETDVFEKYHDFFTLISLISKGRCDEHARIMLPLELSTSLEYIKKNLKNKICVSGLAKVANMSVSTFERKFKENIGMSPREYITQRRLSLAAMLLMKGDSVSYVSEECGFSDYSYFIMIFKKKYGLTPLEFKKERTSIKKGQSATF